MDEAGSANKLVSRPRYASRGGSRGGLLGGRLPEECEEVAYCRSLPEVVTMTGGGLEFESRVERRERPASCELVLARGS